MKRLHLLCNAHLDPAWLWEIEEGMGEALSTFRIAADFCEKYDGFVFNHNEVILYDWVERFEPELFARIQRLVREGRWHIMGGWYLQPDCNMPSGESFVRQMLAGRHYFKEKFDRVPTTAINFDPFGHSRGLVQIMAKAGYDSYIVCRPSQDDCPLPADEVRWIGYDGSSVIAHRTFEAYLTGRGKARAKVERWLEKHPERTPGLVLWGIGNHGGGPSREDIEQLKQLMDECVTREIVHSTPEAYFRELAASGAALPEHRKDLNPWAVGCYTSQIRIKQKHRQLESELYLTEKLSAHAAIAGLIDYPKERLDEAQRDLMTAQFHDMLPGSSIREVEEATIRLLDHGLETAAREKIRAIFALTASEPQPKEGEVPIFIYNPHPFPVKGVFDVEYQPAVSTRGQIARPFVHRNGVLIPSQWEKVKSNLYIDWRKRVVFQAELAPGQISRFDVSAEILDRKPEGPAVRSDDDYFYFENGELEVAINRRTGLADRFAAGGRALVKPGAFRPIVIQDHDDAWGSQVQRFPKVIGAFKLMSKTRAQRVSGVRNRKLEAVRVIEDGDARTVIEALLEYGSSALIITYKLPKQGKAIDVELTVHWNEKAKMLKLAVPVAFGDPRYVGQVAYGRDEFPRDGREVVTQQWNGVVSDQDGLALTCLNDGIYGSDMTGEEWRLTLLRSPGYSALPGGKLKNTMAQDRYSDRIDQGERRYRFRFEGGAASERLEAVDREALAFNEKPYALTYFPPGKGKAAQPLARLSDSTVLMTAFKRAEREADAYIVRLFEPTGQARRTVLELPLLGIRHDVALQPFEIKTLKVVPAARTIEECPLMEMDVQKN
jgi:alpha-mannosidase